VAGPATGRFWSTTVAVIAHAIFDDGFAPGDVAGWSATGE